MPACYHNIIFSVCSKYYFELFPHKRRRTLSFLRDNFHCTFTLKRYRLSQNEPTMILKYEIR